MPIDTPTLLGALVIALVIGLPLFFWIRKRRVERNGRVVTGTVVAIESTHVLENNQPLMKLTFDYPMEDGSTHRASTRSTIAPGSWLPEGAQTAIVVDPKNPDRVYLADNKARKRAGLTTDSPANVRVTVRQSSSLAQMLPNNAAGDAVIDSAMQQATAASLALGGPPRQEPVVGEVTAIRPLDDGRTSVQVDVIRIARASQTVFCTQTFPEGIYFEVGDRVYLQIDTNDPPHAGFILPLSISQGRRIPRTGNRTDSLVLAMDLLFAGSKAQGTILSVEQQPLPEMFARNGASKWEMQVHIQPADGSPAYTGDCSIAVSNAQKASCLNRAGLVIPIRYDPADPATFAIDSIALGFGDPRVAEQEAIRIALQNAH